MTVRTAKPADAIPIARIHVETWHAAYRGQIPDSVLDALNVERRLAFWRERLSQSRGSVFVAEEGEQVVGFCDWIPSRDKDVDPQGVAEIVAIYVLPPYWRKGKGRALCGMALAEARRCGYKAVTLWVLASNAAAKRFYEAMGFRLDGIAKTEKTADGVELQEVRFRVTL